MALKTMLFIKIYIVIQLYELNATSMVDGEQAIALVLMEIVNLISMIYFSIIMAISRLIVHINYY